MISKSEQARRYTRLHLLEIALMEEAQAIKDHAANRNEALMSKEARAEYAASNVIKEVNALTNAFNLLTKYCREAVTDLEHNMRPAYLQRIVEKRINSGEKPPKPRIRDRKKKKVSSVSAVDGADVK
jgi:hypothetical protein